MRIDELMTAEVHTCAPHDTLATAARSMWEHDCGSLPVCTGDGARQIVGMITDRDVCMAALFAGRPLQDLSVADAMSSEVRACRVEDTPAEVEQMMRAARVRRVPVVDGAGNMIGIVSLADLARRPRGAGSEEPTEAGVCSTLAAICEPGRSRPAA